MSVTDTLGRPLRDLRISVTDRCNFRCVYCMPKEVFGRDYRVPGPRRSCSPSRRSRGSRARSSRTASSKIRLTGGEPLLRRDLERLVERLAGDRRTSTSTLTTNGVAARAARREALDAAGLQRVTVSLDSLDDATFRAMNDVDFPVARVLDGIDAAAAAGLAR